jgi:4-amino-4-deoxy-L-arabinose transferase-like glycosyltransferase
MALVALLVRLAVIPFVYDEWLSPYFVSHWEPGNVARALLAGEGFGSPFLSHQPSAIMTPVYPMIIAGIFAIFGVHTKAAILAALGLNSLFSALAAIPIFLLARNTFGDSTARFAGWAWALFPYGVYFSAEWAWSTHLLLLCLCWLLYLAQRLRQSTSVRAWAGFGLLAGFTALTEPVVIPVFLVLLCFSVRCLWKSRTCFVRPVLSAVLCFAFMLAPWSVRNSLALHHFVPVRSGMGLELYLGNNGYDRHWRSGDLQPNHNAAELDEYNRAGEVVFMNHKMSQAMQYIRTHPQWYVWMCVRRAVYMWTGYWSFDKDYLQQEPMDLANIPVATIITLLALAGLLIARRFHPEAAARYGVLLLVYPAVYYLVHPETYYLRPLDPILLMLSCYALVRLREAWRSWATEPLPQELPVPSFAND